ncbi:RNA polymerase sigma factor [Streptoalloteichus hindustanus]|uniref:Sigma-70 region 2 n=1 Tax=Streptoalloteichus hindustanus TaxID=2017 RepID=A0A1M5PVC8_STRHI|nr:sigma factor [Streptoalloteichus hindustanus]SHH05576.1 Sigma-70 region 2 [Streptoalloteichus hindustanus]
MRSDSFWGQLVRALARNTPAFRSTSPEPTRPGADAELLSALARQTPAFTGAPPVSAPTGENEKVVAPDRRWEGLDGVARHAACLEAARAGNQEALAALVSELTPLIWHVARGNGANRGQAEDVVATVWLGFLRQIREIGGTQLPGWLIRVAAIETERVLRPMRRASSLSTPRRIGGAGGGSDPGGAAALREALRPGSRWDALRGAVGRLNRTDPVPDRLIAQVRAFVR